MTSSVKQALPQVLMPKAGVDGKAPRSRTPQGDFAEALGIGKSAKQVKLGEAKSDRQEIEVKPLWQRLAANLDTAAAHSREIAAKLAAAASPEETETEELVDDKPGKHHEGDGVEAAPSVARPAVDAQIAAVPTAPATAAAQTGATPQREPAVSHEEPPADRAPPALIVDGGKVAPPGSSDTAHQQDSAAPSFVPMGGGEPPEPVRFEPAARSVSPSGPSDDRQAADASQDKHADPAKPAPRVTIVSQQSIPAPMLSTAIVLAESIAASDLLEPAKTTLSLDAIHASAAPVSASSLKIQLHPAELGMVTATLRFAGEQLSIELQVENHEAYRRLSSDSDTIVGSLRDLGYDVDHVTVLQPALVSIPTSRSDIGAATSSSQGRPPDQSGSGAAGAGTGGSGGRQSENGGNAGRNGHQNPAATREQQGGGLYI
jgi:chemotaxis protein MotD